MSAWREQGKTMGSFLSRLCEEPVDDTFDWGGVLEYLWNSPDSRPMGLLLTGPDGCGKHTAMKHMLKNLLGHYEIMMVNGSALDESDNVRSELLDEFSQLDDQHVCLVLDELEGRSCRRDVFEALGALLTGHYLSRVFYPKLFVILIDRDEDDIPSSLRCWLLLCRMTLPDGNKRRAYLEERVKRDELWSNGESVERLLASTRGFTYAQLRDLAALLGVYISAYERAKENGVEIPNFDEGLLEFIESQGRDQRSSEHGKHSGALAKEFLNQASRLVSSLGSRLDRAMARADGSAQKSAEIVAEAISAGGSSVINSRVQAVVSQRTAADIEAQNSAYEGDEMTRISNLSPIELDRELWAVLEEKGTVEIVE